MDNFQHIELVISAIHGKAEEKACISLVNNLKIYKWISIVFVFLHTACKQSEDVQCTYTSIIAFHFVTCRSLYSMKLHIFGFLRRERLLISFLAIWKVGKAQVKMLHIYASIYRSRIAEVSSLQIFFFSFASLASYLRQVNMSLALFIHSYHENWVEN